MSKAFRTYHGDSGREEVARTRREYEKKRRAVLKALAGWILMRNSVDFRVVKRFRFWQVRILKEKVVAFKRILRSTNRNYLSSRLRVVLKIFKSGLSATLATWRQGQAQIELPSDIRPQLAAGKFGVLVQFLQAKPKLYSHFRQPLGTRKGKISKSDLVLWTKSSLKRAFTVWLSKAYKPEPLLHRKYQLLLQTKVLLEKRLLSSKSHSWRLLKRHTAYPNPAPLTVSLKTPLFRLLRYTFFQLKKGLSDNSRPKITVFAGIQALKSVLDTRFDRHLRLLWGFSTWKYAKKWSDNREGARSLKRLANIGTRKAFFEVVTKQEGRQGGFDIDKHIIANQALLLVHLEKELMKRNREAQALERAYSLHVLSASAQSRVRSYLHHWLFFPAADLHADLTHEKEEIFSYLQQLEEKIGLNQVQEGEEELSGSRFSDFENIRAKIGRLSADSGALDE